MSVFTDNMGPVDSAYSQLNNSLMQSALQQRALAQSQQQFAQEHALRQQEFNAQQQQGLAAALESGAKPVDASGNVPVQGPAVQNNPMAANPADRFTLNGSQTTNLPATEGQTFKVAGRTMQAPSPMDLLNQHVATARALQDADRIPISDKLANAIGVPTGTKLSPEHMAGFGMLAHWMNPPAADSSPSVLKTEITKDDQGNQTAVNILSNGKTEEIPIKAKGRTAASERDGADRQLTPDAALNAREKAIKDYQEATKEESELNSQRLRLGTALRSGQHYVITNEKGGSTLKPLLGMTDDEKAGQQSDMRNQFQAASNRLKQVISQKNDALNRAGATPGVSTADAHAAIDAGTQSLLGTPVDPAAPVVPTTPVAPAQAQPTAVQTAPGKAPAAMKQINGKQLADYVTQYKAKTGKTITSQQAADRFKAAQYQVVQ